MIIFTFSNSFYETIPNFYVVIIYFHICFILCIIFVGSFNMYLFDILV